MPRRSGMTPADHARRVHARDPSLGPSAIAREVAAAVGHPVTRQQVAAAIAADPKRRGGKRRLPPHARVSVAVPTALLPYLDARVADDAVYSGRADALLAAAEAELVPDAEWETYRARRGVTLARGQR